MSNIEFDLYHLSAFTTGATKEEINPDYLKQSATDAFISFFKALKECDHESDTKVKLPKPTVSIPREKPLPAEKPKTRWEQFVEQKGLKFQEKEKKVLDEDTGEWCLRYGYKRANDPLARPIIEVPNNENAEDPFTKLAREKKERVAEQKKREVRNKKRAERAIKEAAVVASLKGNKRKEQIQQALDAASHPGSSASMNQFNKVKNKVGIFEEGSSVPKIFDRNKGQKPKLGKK
ncbi:hypothetical protein TVAG_027760 [Trichomonas vaginalis G3]|uniref:Ribosome biogenesis regulatory protein n=1 Tax=Trichomonas vaginalis (strain ATCC PRA-98 / G3) TaxID=412133 RepID=A2E515_TRIV3|nr:ribosomal large subunit export from nucleus [Trichomonas vaginalis G3]EAY12223.1 hypothetical protein TVAG_027760 [Trichomonas vaginalis G3]KAI5536009.1 ribosomal large subunit export from nucleus [Trichomonas vaginalis G3]|eukprot:XP_001324446.1 hypothetical protein [Trichomonas vaginalis G3]